MPRSTMSLMNAFTIADRTFPLSCWAEPHKTSVSSIPQQVPQDPLSIVSYLWPYFACCELSRSTFLAGECQRTCLPKENPKVCKCIPIVFQNSKKLFWRIALDEKNCCSENPSLAKCERRAYYLRVCEFLSGIGKTVFCCDPNPPANVISLSGMMDPHHINHYHLDRAPVHKCSNTNFKWTAPWRIVMASLQQRIIFSSINAIAQ